MPKLPNKGPIFWFTGLSGSGKSTLACKLKTFLNSHYGPTALLDGDVLRTGLNKDLGFSDSDRKENLRRAAEIASLFSDQGLAVVAAFITPLEESRTLIRSVLRNTKYTEIYVNCPLEECERRDPKGLYKKARSGAIPEFTGITSPFEIPEYPDLTVNTYDRNIDDSFEIIAQFVRDNLRLQQSGNRFKRKVLVVGLDSMPAEFIFHEYKKEFRNLHKLMEHGVWGTLKSTDPPITVPAWTCITTGRDPGELGLYGFRNRKGPDYSLTIADSRAVHEPRLWDHIEASGGKTVLIGIPQTYPALPHNGITIADFLSPGIDEYFTYPSSISAQLKNTGKPGYLPDVKEFRTENKAELLEQIYAMLHERFGITTNYLTNKDWDFFMMVEIAPDRMHHAFWRYCRKDHRSFDPESPYKNALKQFYRELDAYIGSVLSILDDKTTIILCSDHGSKTMKGGVCINEWLVEKGYLVLHQRPVGRKPLTPDMVDWSKTKAWGEGGYYARIYLNVAGRERLGFISIDEYESELKNLTEDLLDFMRSDDLGINCEILRPSEIYRSVQGQPPDLIVYFGDLEYRSIGSVGTGCYILQENDTGPDDANHDHNGFFLMTRMADLRAGNIRNVRIENAECLDITPTVLHELEIAIPDSLSGKMIDLDSQQLLHRAGSGSDKADTLVTESKGYNQQEEDIVLKRLEELGYI